LVLSQLWQSNGTAGARLDGVTPRPQRICMLQIIKFVSGVFYFFPWTAVEAALID